MERMAIFWITALSVFLLDRVTKLLALRHLIFGQSVTVLDGVLEWRLTHNQGMALGLLSGNAVAIIVLPVLVVAAGWLVMRQYRATRYTRLAAALIVGGFLGNLADRIIMGYVLDMIYFPWMPWYICNPADIAICAGVAMLVISLLFRPQDWRRKREGRAHEADDLNRSA